MHAGILPVKRLVVAKQRIADELGDEARRALGSALLDDALALCAAADWFDWWVVTADAAVARRAERFGFGILTDPGGGLNQALSHAVAHTGALGATSVTIIPADVPLGSRGDLMDLFDVGTTSDLAVVPALRDGGTNALFMSRAGLIEPAFGPRSLELHLDAASRARLRCSILQLPRLALDIDRGEDVVELLERPEASTTATGKAATRWLERARSN